MSGRHQRSRAAAMWGLRVLLPLALLAFIVVQPAAARALGERPPTSGRSVPAPSILAASGYLPGVDISHWQDAIDWSRVAASGPRFAFAKATEGRSYVDPYYAINKASAMTNGLAFGAYHFARPDGTSRDAIQEADHFVDVAALGPGNLLPVLDLERTGGLDQPTLIQWMFDWLQRVQARLGVKPLIYTSPNGWLVRTGDTRVFADAGYPLWLAHWGVSAPTVPGEGWGGRGWTFWQWTDCGSVPGITGCVDMDAFAGAKLGAATIRQLTVSIAAPGGTVVSVPTGIDCGLACVRNFDPGSTVTLSPVPDPGAVFLGWGGDCSGTGPCTVAMTGNRSVTATFGYPLTVALEGTGEGVVASSPAGIDCGVACTADFPTGTVVTLTPTAAQGSLFSTWGVDCTGNDTCTVTVDRPRSVVATFVDDLPPTVTLSARTSLTGPVNAGFSEIVHKVGSGNFVLRAEGSTENVPAKVSCTSPKGVAVDCSTGNVVSATLTPTSALVPGQRYAAAVNPEGSSPRIVDRGVNPAPTTSIEVSTPTEVEQGSPAAGYAWRPVRSGSAFGGSYVVEHLAGARVSFAFAGSSVTWYTVAGPTHGTAAVTIDGRSRGTFDQYSPSSRFRVARPFTGLGGGQHTIQILVRGVKGSSRATGTEVAVDAFRVGDRLAASPEARAWWRTVRASPASGGSISQSDLAGSVASLTFRGTRVDWYTVTGPNQGRARIVVDGKAIRTVDNYSARTTYGVRRTVGGLVDRVHTVRIEVTGEARTASRGAFVSVDRWVVRAPAA